MRSPLGFFWLLCLSKPPVARSNDVPNPKDFLHRNGQRAVVLGNYVYIDGGEVGWKVDGETGSERRTVNSTLVIDISKSWSSDSVQIKTIPKEAPKLMGHALWTWDYGFYSWGGFSPGRIETNELTPDKMWHFTIDGQGLGRGENETVELYHEGACVSTNDAGFCFGGQQSRQSQHGRIYTQSIPGFISFNMTKKDFTNESASQAFKFGTVVGGRAEFLPPWGLNGLIAVLGGSSHELIPDTGVWEARDFNNLTLYDPTKKRWYWQSTTGDAPSPRERFCTVSVASGPDSYDIFVFGGEDPVKRKDLGDIYVLSLPAFVWHKVEDAEQSPRVGHSCVVLGGRQMLSIGGVHGDWSDPDKFAQGLGIFDMTKLRWGKDYDVNAGSYVGSNLVYPDYWGWGIDSVEWSSPELRIIFDSGIWSKPSIPPTDKPKYKAPVAAIAGGLVGGVVGLATVLTLIWVLRGRKLRRLQEATAAGEDSANNPAGKDTPPEL